MKILIYLLNSFLHLFSNRIAFISLIDNFSKVDKTARIFRFVKLVNSRVGRYTYIAKGTEVIYSSIGNFCSIGPDCRIGLPTHELSFVSTSPIFFSNKNALKISWAKRTSTDELIPIKIGNDVWIGTRAIILGGVSIGNGAVVGAGAIVTKDVPPYAIVVGIPASVIRYRFSESTIRILEDSKWWNLPENVLRSNIEIFNDKNINISVLLEDDKI